MKKTIFALVLLLVLGLTGCAGSSDNDDIIEIGERFFVNQMTEIFLNHSQYMGRTIRYEGMFRTARWGDMEFSVVYRNVPGCCSPEEVMGFEVVMDGFELFEDNAWVEVTGVLDFDGSYIIIRVTEIVELEERGAEWVS